MAYYEFRNRSSGRTVNLSTVDEYICKLLGEPVREKQYHPVYQVMVEWAFGGLMAMGGGHVEFHHLRVPRLHYKKASVDLQRSKDERIAAMHCWRIMEHCLLEKYEFHAWR